MGCRAALFNWLDNSQAQERDLSRIACGPPWHTRMIARMVRKCNGPVATKPSPGL